jgi:predicted transcriptional regulator
MEAVMSTTTIRLPDDLRARVAQAAEHAGTSSHNFILQAIAEKTEREELQAGMRELSEQRLSRLLTSGASIPWEEMRNYLERRMAGKNAARPVGRKLAEEE